MIKKFSELEQLGLASEGNNFLKYLYQKTGGKAMNPQSSEDIKKALKLEGSKGEERFHKVKNWLKDNHYIYEREDTFILGDVGVSYIFSEKENKKPPEIKQL